VALFKSAVLLLRSGGAWQEYPHHYLLVTVLLALGAVSLRAGTTTPEQDQLSLPELGAADVAIELGFGKMYTFALPRDYGLRADL
jgi:hypothetical protein